MLINKLRKLLDSREISVRELVGAYMDRIDAIDGGGGGGSGNGGGSIGGGSIGGNGGIIGNGGLNTFIHVNAGGATAAADAAQSMIDAGEQGPLTGIPIALGDDICTNDMPMTCASRILDGYRPPFDAAVTERLRAQGAVFLGKLNIDEFSMYPSNTFGPADTFGPLAATSYYGRVLNPYDITCASGGPAGGAAAAVAAGLCAAAIGVDAGGAIGRPAALCGVTGFRPTYGYVSRHGCVANTSAFDQAGPIAAGAEDCALILNAISGYCPYDIITYEYKSGGKSGGTTGTAGTARTGAVTGARTVAGIGSDSLKGLRLGMIRELFDDRVDPQVRESVLKAASWYEQAGATVFEVSIPMLRHGDAAYYIIACVEAFANLGRFDGVRYGRRVAADNYNDMVARSRGEGFGREVKKRILFGTHILSGDNYDKYYRKAVTIADSVRARYNEVLQQADALISPAAPHVAPQITPQLSTTSIKTTAEDIWSVGPSLAGLPSVTTPCGYVAPCGYIAQPGSGAHLPVGLALTGKRCDDMFVLGLAAAFEKDFNRQPPPLADNWKGY
ncbi:MAG: amidase family protein [Oscillospiraceae bacterium]|nr:amidase family protein [Oscillospiraceae bacterium]